MTLFSLSFTFLFPCLSLILIIIGFSSISDHRSATQDDCFFFSSYNRTHYLRLCLFLFVVGRRGLFFHFLIQNKKLTTFVVILKDDSFNFWWWCFCLFFFFTITRIIHFVLEKLWHLFRLHLEIHIHTSRRFKKYT